MRKVLLIVCLCTIFGRLSFAQQSTTTLKGVVFEGAEQIPVAGCNVSVETKNGKIGTVTSADGRYELKISNEQALSGLTIEITHINFHRVAVKATPGKIQNVILQRKVYNIGDVTVHSAYSSNNTGNKFVYTPLQASSSISIIGEPDVVRHISSLPGVAQGIEGTLGLFVRGSNNGSNRIEFNDVPFYSYAHLLGLFSAFSPEVIETTTFRPGGIPAQSGNLSSSLLQITPKKTLNQTFSGKLTLSPYMTGGYLSLPLKKDKLSLQIAGRTSFMPWLINQAVNLQESDDDEEVEAMKGQVLDFTALLDWKINSTNTFDFMFYTSNDYFDFKDSYSQNKLNWSSTAVKAGWKSQLSSQLRLKTTTYYSSTHSLQEQLYFDEWTPEKTTSQLRLGTKLNEWSVNSMVDYRISEFFGLKAGINYQLQVFEPASEKTIYTQNLSSKYNDALRSNLLAGFIDIAYNKPDIMELTLGYRHTLQHVDGQNRNNFDIRFLGDFHLNQKLGLELSYDKLTQYYHVLEGLPTGWSLNVLIPSNGAFPEEVTNQLYSGIFVKPQLQGMELHFTLGGYYRHMQNIVSYINTVNMFGLKDTSWEDETDVGKGQSYGLEVSGAAKAHRFGATVAYTLSKTNRQFAEINNGNVFPFKFDRRHILNLQSKYTIVQKKNKKGHRCQQVINAVAAYSSGHNTTLPVGRYQGIVPPYWNIKEDGWNFPQELGNNAYHRQEMTARNGFKMKDYFRVDLAYTFIKHRTKSTHELAFSVFNVLNRQNPYLFFYEENKWQQLSIAPVMPSIRWSVSF